MKVAIHQPQYLPWLGYFDKIDKADAFVLLDTVQYKKNEWQNRNKIKSVTGWQWMTVPVTYRFPQRIHEVEIDNSTRWWEDHWKSLVTNYSKAAYWWTLRVSWETAFREAGRKYEKLTDLNCSWVKALALLLGIKTPIYVASMDLPRFPDMPDERLIGICKHFKADTYLSGSGGHGYLNLEKFEKAGLKVEFQKFEHPMYSQMFGGFDPCMSVVDLLFNHGHFSLRIIRREL
jgi:hypothetical protein